MLPPRAHIWGMHAIRWVDQMVAKIKRPPPSKPLKEIGSGAFFLERKVML